VRQQSALLWKRRLGFVVLTAAVVALAMHFLPNLPSTRLLVLRIESPDQVQSVSATWTRKGEDTPRGGTELTYSGNAPDRIERRLSLPDGEYVFDVRVVRRFRGTATETSRTHHVTLKGREITLFLQARRP
jgi:hypothetical protein